MLSLKHISFRVSIKAKYLDCQMKMRNRSITSQISSVWTLRLSCLISKFLHPVLFPGYLELRHNQGERGLARLGLERDPFSLVHDQPS